MFEPRYYSARTSSGLLRLVAADQIAETIRHGGLAILPTETGYLLASLATSEEAITKAFDVKRRRYADTMHVACASLRMAEEYAALTPTAINVLGEFTPGPLTIVVQQTGKLPDYLVTLNGTVGIRVPDHPATLQVIEAVGAPVTATSLNESGQPTISVDADSLSQLNWPENTVVHVVRDDASISHSKPSTLVRFGPEGFEVLREGPVSRPEIEAVANASRTTIVD